MVGKVKRVRVGPCEKWAGDLQVKMDIKFFMRSLSLCKFDLICRVCHLGSYSSSNASQVRPIPDSIQRYWQFLIMDNLKINIFNFNCKLENRSAYFTHKFNSNHIQSILLSLLVYCYIVIILMSHFVFNQLFNYISLSLLILYVIYLLYIFIHSTMKMSTIALLHLFFVLGILAQNLGQPSVHFINSNTQTSGFANYYSTNNQLPKQTVQNLEKNDGNKQKQPIIQAEGKENSMQLQNLNTKKEIKNQENGISFSFSINPDYSASSQSTVLKQGTVPNGINFSFGVNGDPSDIPNQNGQKWDYNVSIPEQMSEQMLWFIGAIYFSLFLCLAVVNFTILYFCLKKRSQRNKIKARMQQLQMMFAQSQNMTVLQMNNQVHFPRTMHI